MTLQERRKAMDLTQKDVAEMLEVNQAAVSLWERGKSRPLAKYRRKLAALYECSEAELMEVEPRITA